MSAKTSPKATRREPMVYVAHHVYPQPAEVRQEDVIRLGRHIHEVLRRQAREQAQEGGTP